MLMGCVGGLLGAAWIRINVEMIRVRAKHVPARLPFRRLLEVRAASCCSISPQRFTALFERNLRLQPVP